MKQLAAAVIFILSVNALVYSQQSPFYALSPKFENQHWLFEAPVDSLIGSWSVLQPLAQPLVGVNTYYWPESNKIFICGGIDSSSLLQTSCFFYNIINNNYEPAAPLPEGRWSGQLVRVKDSLYLVGSIDSNFTAPDGKIFRYSLNTNNWSVKSAMPVPKLQECAVCVFKDSLIFTIGGSTDRFQGITSYIRLYDPWNDSWNTSSSIYRIPVTTAHAECKMIDTNATVIVLGGFSQGNVDAFWEGIASVTGNDSLTITWDTTRQFTPFGEGVYRVSGGQMNDYYVFGPGLNNSSTVSQIWALRITPTDYLWTRLLPDMIDSTSNIPQIAIKPGTDTAGLYYFGGYSNPVFSSQVKMLTITGSPIGIQPNKNIIPTSIKLYQNYPNPFNPSTIIKFDISKNTFVKLVVYDVLGREVKTLLNEAKTAGSYSINFNAVSLSSGVYFCTLIAGDLRETKKLLLIK